MTHERLDYNRHFKIPLGSAVEACNQGFPCNQLPERAITGICVGPAKNFQEGHEIGDIKTKAITTRSKITQVPLTHAIIEAVEQHAQRQWLGKEEKSSPTPSTVSIFLTSMTEAEHVKCTTDTARDQRCEDQECQRSFAPAFGRHGVLVFVACMHRPGRCCRRHQICDVPQ